MTKLNNIKGYWDATYSHCFNEVNMWEGKILLEEDGWFEGIVADTNSSYTGDRFIFGVYYPTKVIELFKFAPENISDPFVFHGKMNANGYEGEFELIGLFGPSPYGISRITTQDIEHDKENVDKEIEELKSRIQNYKDNIMGEAGQSFYANSMAMRNSMCQIILREYEGKGFTTEECIQIMEECQPVNDRVMQKNSRRSEKTC